MPAFGSPTRRPRVKLHSPIRCLLGTTLATLLAAGCGATEGTATSTDAQHANETLRETGGGHFGRHPHGPPDPARFVEHFDRNGNGTVELSELPPRLSARIRNADANHDGVLSTDEIRAYIAEHQPGPDAPPMPDAPED